MAKPANTPLRVLGVVRLSNLTDTTSSPERQRGKIHKWADLYDGEVVGIAEDLDVSAIKASPWERPEFGEWLRKPEEFDVIVAWKLDRLARKTADFLALIEWAKKHGVRIATVEENFDLGTAAGRMVATVLAAFAEYEGEVIRERVKDAYERNIKAGNWRGGNVPYGYRPVKRGDHWELEHDPETKEILREIVTRIIGGEAANAIVRDLNARNIPVSTDAQRIRQGKESKGAKWRVANLLKMLRSKTLLGQYEAEGSQYVRNERNEDGTQKKIPRKTIVGDDGLPLQRAEPLITMTEWQELQAKLDKNSSGKTHHRAGGAPLRQVAFCGVCKRPLYRVHGRSEHYYRCSSSAVDGTHCGNTGARSSELEPLLETELLGRIGKLERKTKVFIPGEDHTEELEQVIEAMSNARKERDRGDYDYPGGAEEYSARIQKLAEKRKHLASLPQVPSRTEWVGTGETFADYWATLDEHGKGAFYREAGIRLEVLRWPGKMSLNLEEIPDGTVISFGRETYVLGERTTKTKQNKPMKVTLIFGDIAKLYLQATSSQESEEATRAIMNRLIETAVSLSEGLEKAGGVVKEPTGSPN